jgi:membrane protein
MRRRWTAFFSLLKETVLKWNADNCLRLAASLSYYTLFSIFPLILVLLAVVQFLLNNSDTGRAAILDALARVTGGFRDEFVQTLEIAQQARRASGLIGAAALLLGASWVFGELVSAFNIIWGLQAPERGGPLQFVRATVFSFALVLATAFLLLVSMIVDALLTALGTMLEMLPGGVLVWGVAHNLISMLVLIGLFALLLKYLPQTKIAWGDIWLGAVLTAVLWILLQYAIVTYIAWSSYQDYGAVGAILALIVWVYLSSQVLFLGGEFTNCYARRYGSRKAATDPSSR